MSAAIGVDLGGTKMLVGVVDGGRNVLCGDRDDRRPDQDELVELLEREVGPAIEARPDVEAVGLGIPARSTASAASPSRAVNLPIADVPIRDLIAERIGLPVFVDNDANLAALAEHRFGAGRGTPQRW